jgi:hypothetical protein
VRDGTEAARIRVVANRPRTAVVQADGTGLRNAHPYHTYQGLVIDGAYGTGDLVLGNGGDHAEFIDVEVRRSGRDCFDLRNVTDVRIEGSFIHHCVALDEVGEIADAHGVTGDSVFDLTILRTEIAMTSGDSLQLSPPREPWGNVRVEGCTLWTAPLDDADAGAPGGHAHGRERGRHEGGAGSGRGGPESAPGDPRYDRVRLRGVHRQPGRIQHQGRRRCLPTEMLGSWWMTRTVSEHEDEPSVPALSADERSQISERLDWSPSERLRYLLDMLDFEELARRARRADSR